MNTASATFDVFCFDFYRDYLQQIDIGSREGRISSGSDDVVQCNVIYYHVLSAVPCQATPGQMVWEGLGDERHVLALWSRDCRLTACLTVV